MSIKNRILGIAQSSLSINEAFAARRAELLALRNAEFQHKTDFAPYNGICQLWNIHLPGEPRCNYDLVAHFGDEYATADITYCPHCHSSFTD